MQELSRPRHLLALWGGVLLGPAAWFVAMQAKYALVPWVCVHGGRHWLDGIVLLSLAVVGVGCWLAWREWRYAGAEWPDAEGSVVSRSRFMAVSGLLLSAISGLLVLAQWIPAFVLDPCQQ